MITTYKRESAHVIFLWQFGSCHVQAKDLEFAWELFNARKVNYFCHLFRIGKHRV